MAVLLFAPATALRAQTVVDIASFELLRNDEGLSLSFAVQFDLPRGVEDALLKGVPLYFTAEADVFRDRWYWRDRRISSASRTWRVAYQPLTRKYRVTFGGLSQNFDQLEDAMGSVRRIGAWKLADAALLEDGARHYVEFRYWLDTAQLPRPMQIGIAGINNGGLADWTLKVERLQRVSPP